MEENKAGKLGKSTSIVIRNKTYDSLTTLNKLQDKSRERIESQNRNMPLTTVQNDLSTKKELQTGIDRKVEGESDAYNNGLKNHSSNPKKNISLNEDNMSEKVIQNHVISSSEIQEQKKKRIESQNESTLKTETKDNFSTKNEVKTIADTKSKKDDEFSVDVPSRFGTENKQKHSNINNGKTIASSDSETIKTGIKTDFSTEKQLKTGVKNESNNIHVSPAYKQISISAKSILKDNAEKEIVGSVKNKLDEQEDLGSDSLSAFLSLADDGVKTFREGKRTAKKIKSHIQSKREKSSRVYRHDTVNGKVEQNQKNPHSEKEYKIHSQIKNDTVNTSVKAKYDTNYSLSSNAISVDSSKKNYEIINKTIGNSKIANVLENASAATGGTTVAGTTATTAGGATVAGATATTAGGATVAGATATTAGGATVAGATATTAGGATVAGATATTAGGATVAGATVSALPIVAIVLGVIIVSIIVMVLVSGLMGMLSPNISENSGIDVDETKWITEKITQERKDLIAEIKTIYKDNKGNYEVINFSNTLNSSSVVLDDSNLNSIENDMYTVDDYVQAMQPVFHTLLLERYELSPSNNEMETVFDELWEKMNSLTTQETQQTVNVETSDSKNNFQEDEDIKTLESDSGTTIKTLTITLNTNGYYDLLNACYLNDINILQAKADVTEEEKKRLNELNEYYTLCTTYADVLQESGVWIENGVGGTSAYIPDGGYMPSEAYDDATVGAIFTEANKWLGTPYEMPPHMPNTFDCSGFVWYVFQYSGVKNWGRTTAQGIFDQCTPIAIGEAKAGDLVFFQGTYDAGRTVTHIGIYCGDGTMIHAGNPVKRASINTTYWQQHFYSFGRLN